MAEPRAESAAHIARSFAILVKSHGPDLPYVERLLASFEKFNVDGIELYLVVPTQDFAEFTKFSGQRVTVMSEDVLAEHLVSESVNGYTAGYINQEIVKLAFWETGLAENYLCMDSDAEFIRDIHVSDFMVDAMTPYTFLTEDRALRADPGYYEEHWVHRQPHIERIAEEIGLADQPLRTVHGHAVFSATVLRAFWDRFLSPRGWGYSDALRVSPYEPTWYSFWLLKDRTIPIVTREPIIKTFHSATDYLGYATRGISLADTARAYAGIVINSNFSRGDGLVSLDDPGYLVMARYRTAPEIARALARACLHR